MVGVVGVVVNGRIGNRIVMNDDWGCFCEGGFVNFGMYITGGGRSV